MTSGPYSFRSTHEVGLSSWQHPAETTAFRAWKQERTKLDFVFFLTFFTCHALDCFQFWALQVLGIHELGRPLKKNLCNSTSCVWAVEIRVRSSPPDLSQAPRAAPKATKSSKHLFFQRGQLRWYSKEWVTKSLRDANKFIFLC